MLRRSSQLRSAFDASGPCCVCRNRLPSERRPVWMRPFGSAERGIVLQNQLTHGRHRFWRSVVISAAVTKTPAVKIQIQNQAGLRALSCCVQTYPHHLAIQRFIMRKPRIPVNTGNGSIHLWLRHKTEDRFPALLGAIRIESSFNGSSTLTLIFRFVFQIPLPAVVESVFCQKA